MASVPGKFLNQENIIKKVFDETTDSLRVNASVSGVNVDLSAASGDNVAISDGVDTLVVNPDGSINVNAGSLVISHIDDSIRLGDGTNLISSTAVGLKQGLDVNILNQTTGEVKITDGTDTVNVNPDGSLNVNIVGGSITPIVYTTVNQFNEINSVASGTLTTIQTYTVPFGKSGYFQRVDTSGENIAKYTVKVNSGTVDVKRTYFGNSLNAEFDFLDSNDLGINLVAGDVITIQVIHNRPTLSSFDSRLQIILYTPIANLTTVNTYTAISNVPSASLVTIGSYTVGIGTSHKLQKISCSGENIAKYIVYINSLPIDVNRTYFGGSLNVEFNFTSSMNSGYELSSGDLIEIKVYHTRVYTADFNSRIQILEI